jgi:hypothetical protein
MEKTDVKLTSSEMANIWTAYINDSMAICVFKYFLQHIEDQEIKQVIEYALSLSQKHIDTLTKIMTNENFAIPQGFGNQDVNLTAPRLYSDTFYLYYIMYMAKFASNTYTMALATIARRDIRSYFTECEVTSVELLNQSTDVALAKGILVRPPYIAAPQKVDFVQKQSFLTGWFGDRRPLTPIEIMNLFFNIRRNVLGKSLLLGFSQVAKLKKVREYMERGVQIATKHVEVFSSLLSEDYLPAPMTWDTLPTESTDSPFSDKLMMFHTSALISAGIGYYGASLGASPRRDLSSHYTRLMAETTQYLEDGANIMIDNGWLEQPPSATDREAIINSKK